MKKENLTPRQKLVLAMIRRRPGFRPKSYAHRDRRSIQGLLKRKLVRFSREHGGYVAVDVETGLLPPAQTQMSWHPQPREQRELQEFAR